MTDTVQINTSPLPAAGTLGLRQGLLILTAAKLGAEVVRLHGWGDLLDWFQTSPAEPLVDIGGMALTAAWGQISAWRKHRVMEAAAASPAVTNVVFKA